MNKPNLQKESATLNEKSEELLRNIIENSSDQIFMIDKNYKYLLVNSALANFLSKSPKEIIGKSISDVYPLETATRFSKNIGNVFESGKSMFIEEKMSVQGKELEISTSLNPVKDHTGKLIAVTGIVRDITQRKNLEKQLHEAERLAAIGQTAAMVGHDIRNPLQAMIGEVYLLKDTLNAISNDNSKKDALENLDNIEKNIGYINKIVADLQDYSRTLFLEITDVNLYELVIKVVKSIDIPKSINYFFEIAPSIRLKSDSYIISRILTNLILNSVQAMPNGGKLLVGAYCNHDKVLIEVTDTGVGIPEEIKPKLFTPMFTTKAKGQGLGLAVVKRLVEELNGEISFESEVGKGTKIMITLPIHQPTKKLLLHTNI